MRETAIFVSFRKKKILHPAHPQCSQCSTWTNENPSFDCIKMSIRIAKHSIRTLFPITYAPNTHSLTQIIRASLFPFFFGCFLLVIGVAWRWILWISVTRSPNPADVFRVQCETIAPFLCCFGHVTWHRDLNIDEFLVANYENRERRNLIYYSGCWSAIKSSDGNFVYGKITNSKLCGVCQFMPGLMPPLSLSLDWFVLSIVLQCVV